MRKLLPRLATAGLGAALALMFFDLNGLKQTNDSRGHQAGDERLKGLARAMSTAVREGDSAYRVSGDEFALILAGSRAREGLEVAKRIQNLMSESEAGNVTAGVAEAGPGIDRDELIRKADVVLIEAKRAGRPVLVYSLEMDTSAAKRARQVELGTVAAALAQAVDAKGSLNRRHSETVAELSVAIGTELGLGAQHVSDLRMAGLLHDVGKVGIPDAILTKPGSLSDNERAVMNTHSMLGQGIVEALGLPQQAEWILHHHERVDGTGYPGGLSGEQIPLESRIVLVADAFEAITADRPYRKGRPDADALEELREHAGTQFDPRCVAALEQALARRRDAEAAVLS
jgi:diguanylate cyclase (GGDEF)-like protein